MKALVMSGGGAKAAFHVGILDGLAKAGLDYDYIFGVSAGALVGTLAAESPPGNLQAGADKALYIWDTIVRDDSAIHKRWPLGQYISALWKPSLRNSKPLWELIEKWLDYDALLASGRDLRVGVVGMRTGKYKEVSPRESSKEEFWKWVVASSAVPPMLTPIEIGDDIWLDGGARTITPFRSAINAGCDHIDVIVTRDVRKTMDEYDISDNWSGTKFNLIDVIVRGVDILTDEIFARDVLRDLKTVQHINRRIELGDPEMVGKKIITVREFKPWKNMFDVMDFSHEKNQLRIEHGREVVQNILGG